MLRNLLIAVLLLPLAPRQELRFVPTQGAELRITFEREANLELTAMEMLIDGASHGDVPTPELSLEAREKNVLLDRYAQVEGARVTRLVRTFEVVSAQRFESVSAPDGPETNDYEAASDLEGSTVVFEWDADDEEYVPRFEEGEGDAELLEDLRAELDLRVFLPADEVGEGDAWDVPAAAVGLVLAPGGNLKLMAEGRSLSDSDVKLARNLEGDVRATLQAAREEDGVALAVIALEVEVETRAERELEPPEGPGVEVQHNEYELSGELLWDPAAGRFHALELSGKVTSRIVTHREVEMGERSFEVDRTLELAGDVRYRLGCEPQ